MDLDEPYAVVCPGEGPNSSMQWIIVRAEALIERLRSRATDEAWRDGAIPEVPLEAVAAYDSEDLARQACLMLNEAASSETGRHRDERLAKKTRYGTWGLPGIETGADIHRRSAQSNAVRRGRRDGT